MQIPDGNKFAYFDFDEQLANLYRSGGFYADSEFNKVSVHAHPGYMKFEENHAAKHVGYEASRNNGLNLVDMKKAVNYERYLTDVLLTKSSDFTLKGVFLDGSDFGNKVAYTSYSRSGNTLFRKLLE